MINVRLATLDDITNVLDIYSYYVLNSNCTFEEVVPSLDEMINRFEIVTKLGFPYLVLECEGVICGYCYASKFHPRVCYRFTAENSVYVRNGHHGNGYGFALMSALIPKLRDIGIKNIIASISSRPSIDFHKRIGFTEIGTLERVGFKFNQWIDTTFMQLKL